MDLLCQSVTHFQSSLFLLLTTCSSLSHGSSLDLLPVSGFPSHFCAGVKSLARVTSSSLLSLIQMGFVPQHCSEMHFWFLWTLPFHCISCFSAAWEIIDMPCCPSPAQQCSQGWNRTQIQRQFSEQQGWCALNMQNQDLCLYSIREATYQTNLKSINTCVCS